MAAIHFVDIRQIGDELRPVCGTWSDDVTWTTLRHIATCPLCLQLVGEGQPVPPPRARYGRSRMAAS